MHLCVEYVNSYLVPCWIFFSLIFFPVMLNLFPLPKKTSHEKRTWTENRKEVTSLWSYLIIFSIQIARKHQLEQLFTFANGKINNNPNFFLLRLHAKLKCDRISIQKYTRSENQFKRFVKKRHTHTRTHIIEWMQRKTERQRDSPNVNVYVDGGNSQSENYFRKR